jgi:hypothetical protein
LREKNEDSGKIARSAGGNSLVEMVAVDIARSGEVPWLYWGPWFRFVYPGVPSPAGNWWPLQGVSDLTGRWW